MRPTKCNSTNLQKSATNAITDLFAILPGALLREDRTWKTICQSAVVTERLDLKVLQYPPKSVIPYQLMQIFMNNLLIKYFQIEMFWFLQNHFAVNKALHFQ